MDDDLIRIEDPEVNVAEIMRQIRETIKRKKEQGIYTDEEIREISELRIQTFAEPSEIDSELLRKLQAPSHAWNIGSGYRIRTHRTGLQGKLIVLAKRLIRPFVRLYTDHIVDRQAQLNLYFVYLIHNLVRELTKLELECRKLGYRCEVLQRDLDFLRERERALEELAVLKETDEEPGPPRDQSSGDTKDADPGPESAPPIVEPPSTGLAGPRAEPSDG